MNRYLTYLLDRILLHRNRLRWSLFGLAGLSITITVIAFVSFFTRSDAPDPDTAEIQNIADFMKKDEFLEMNSRKRGQYVDSLMRRYTRMTPPQRTRTEETFGHLFRKDRKVKKTFWLSFATQKAEQYHKLPPGEKRQFIDRILTVMEAIDGSEQMKKNYDRSFSSRTSHAIKRKAIKRGLRGHRSILQKTSAEDRSKLARTAGDIVQRLRERYGE